MKVRTLEWYLNRSEGQLAEINYTLIAERRAIKQEQLLLNKALTQHARTARATAPYQEGVSTQTLSPEGIPSGEAHDRPRSLGERFYTWLRS